MKKWNWLMAGGILLLGLTVTAFGAWGKQRQEEERFAGFGMFSWKEEAMKDEEAKALSECIDSAFVTEIYQYFSEENLLSGTGASFVRRMGEKGTAVYALMGEAAWAYEKDGASLIEKIRQVAEYNGQQERQGRIQGVMVDVEPYLLEEWDQGSQARSSLMEGYLQGIECAYVYATGNNLKFLVCIPTFYDATNREILERLIASACDGVAVMNYNRTDEYGQMAMEVGFAREYEKEVICIYELQKAGKHRLEEINTYAEAGMDMLKASAGRLEKQFGYEKLRFAYHYYEPLKEMLQLPL